MEKMTVTSYLSDKIKIMSFVAIILVLYMHSDFHDTPNEIQGMTFNHFLQYIISIGIGSAAVPMFFMISGYLFFRNVTSVNDVYKKMKKRFHTLLVPYIFAALFMPLFLLAIDLFPIASQFTNNSTVMTEQIVEWGFAKSLLAIFWKAPESGSPIAFQLWFLRDLIILVLLSIPLYWFYIKFKDIPIRGGDF